MSDTEHTIGVRSITDLPRTRAKWQRDANALYLVAALTSVIGPYGVRAYKGANDYVAASATRGSFWISCIFHNDGYLRLKATEIGAQDDGIHVECLIKSPLGGEFVYEAQVALEAAGVRLHAAIR